MGICGPALGASLLSTGVGTLQGATPQARFLLKNQVLNSACKLRQTKLYKMSSKPRASILPKLDATIADLNSSDLYLLQRIVLQSSAGYGLGYTRCGI